MTDTTPAPAPGHPRPVRAFHDLNGVDTLVIIGWRGRHEVKPHAAGDRGVVIIAPRRVDGEFWTFEQQRDGVLRCHSDLIGSSSLITETAEPMVILLPADRIDGIEIRFEAVTGTCDDEPIDTGYRDPGIDGCPHFRDPKACDECAAEESHDLYIAQLVQALDGDIASALQFVSGATTSLLELRGPAYDIELAEGWDGSDAMTDLGDAAKLLRNVQRIARERLRLLREG